MKKRVFFIIFIIIGFAVYFNTLGNGFVYDDISIIEKNNYLQYFKEVLPQFFSTKYFVYSKESTYRPVATLTYFINYQLWKLNPFGYHLSNVILHLINVLLLFYLFDKIFKNRITAFIISLTFLVHPVLSEAVNGVTYNEDILTVLFCILSFISYIKISENKKKKNFYFIISLFLFLMALLSKEMAITLPAILLLYDLLKEKFDSKDGFKISMIVEKLIHNIKKNKLYYAGYLIISLLFLYILFFLLKNPNKTAPEDFGAYGFLSRLIFAPYNLFLYIKLALFPLNLSAEYDFHYPESFFTLINIIAYITVFGIIFSSFFIYKYSKKIFFGIWCFIITLLPVLNIIPIYKPIADRILYLPIIGACIIFGVLLTEIFDKIKIRNLKIRNIIRIVLISSIILSFSFLTVRRNYVWKDSYTFWSDVIKRNPKAGGAYSELGLIYLQKKQYDLAEEYCKKAINFGEDKRTYNNLGTIYAEQGRNEDALMVFLKVLEIDPGHENTLLNLGVLYDKMGEKDKAIIYFKKGIEKNLNNVTFYINLAKVYNELNMNQMAIETLILTKEKDPKNLIVMVSLAENYLKINEIDKVYLELNKIISLFYNSAYANLKVGEFYAKLADYGKAEEFTLKAIQYDPKSSGAYLNLGVIYMQQKRYNEALNAWRKALVLDPANRQAGKYLEEMNKIYKR